MRSINGLVDFEGFLNEIQVYLFEDPQNIKDLRRTIEKPQILRMTTASLERNCVF